MICPTHQTEMEEVATRYGGRWRCSVPECSVASWSGSTSTPADDETRRLRQQCHERFDPLWKRRERFRNRNEGYLWMQRRMRLSEEDCHIGRFSKEQCLQLLAILGRS